MNRTDKVVAAVTVGLLAWEGYTLVNNDRDDTISETIWRASHRPLVPLLGGMFAAHLFLQRGGRGAIPPFVAGLAAGYLWWQREVAP